MGFWQSHEGKESCTWLCKEQEESRRQGLVEGTVQRRNAEAPTHLHSIGSPC
ncbi:hypothetical protein Nmel_011186 [Mimus melanotis]